MKCTLFQGLVLSLFILAALPVAATDIIHNFNSKSSAGTLVNDGSTTRSTDDGIVYTRSGASTAFGYNALYPSGTGSTIALNLFANNGYVTVSPAFSHLDEIVINHTSNYSGNVLSSSKLAVAISTDGTDWTSVTPTVSYTAGRIAVTPPAGGPYYIKITSKSTTKVSITQITYTFSDCNCFTYTPE